MHGVGGTGVHHAVRVSCAGGRQAGLRCEMEGGGQKVRSPEAQDCEHFLIFRSDLLKKNCLPRYHGCCRR